MKLLTILALSVCAVAQSTDPAGWNAAKWGMALKDVQAALPAARPIAPEKDLGQVARLQLSPAQLGPFTAAAKLEFQPDRDYLTAVSLTVDGSAIRSSAFETLKQALADKYGRPTTDTTTSDRNAFGSRSTTHTVQWSVKTTSIILTWMDYGDVGAVWVRYSERKPDPSL